jgi:hypothetical protein
LVIFFRILHKEAHIFVVKRIAKWTKRVRRSSNGRGKKKETVLHAEKLQSAETSTVEEANMQLNRMGLRDQFLRIQLR